MNCHNRLQLRARLFSGVCEKRLGQIRLSDAKSGVEMRSLSQRELLWPWRKGRGDEQGSQEILQNIGVDHLRLNKIRQKIDLIAGK